MEANIKGDTDRKLKTMAIKITTFVKERFGTVEKGRIKTQYTKNRRAEKIAHLRHELKLLKKQFKNASKKRKMGL